MTELLAELQNYQNALIMGMTWALVEILTPVIEHLANHPKLGKLQARVQKLTTYGKRLAGMIWSSAIVWIPGAQPKLCVDGAVEGCQVVFNRIAIGIILGALVSGGHWAGKLAWAKFMGAKEEA